MEEDKGSPAYWFALGYLAAILVEIAAGELIRAIDKLLVTTAPTSETVVLESPNGVTGENGEAVTSLVKEAVENE